jgi:hypothetical protein
MDSSQEYALRKTARTLILDSYRSRAAGNVRQLVTNQVTELKKFLLLDLLGNSEIKRQPIGNQGSGKKIQVVEKK